MHKVLLQLTAPRIFGQINTLTLRFALDHLSFSSHYNDLDFNQYDRLLYIFMQSDYSLLYFILTMQMVLQQQWQ